jgi:hypothetical protein
MHRREIFFVTFLCISVRNGVSDPDSQNVALGFHARFSKKLKMGKKFLLNFVVFYLFRALF